MEGKRWSWSFVSRRMELRNAKDKVLHLGLNWFSLLDMLSIKLILAWTVEIQLKPICPDSLAFLSPPFFSEKINKMDFQLYSNYWIYTYVMLKIHIYLNATYGKDKASHSNKDRLVIYFSYSNQSNRQSILHAKTCTSSSRELKSCTWKFQSSVCCASLVLSLQVVEMRWIHQQSRKASRPQDKAGNVFIS